MVDELNRLERRVLGSLMEKHLAQPTYYPMTLNALVAACNQKSNRDPVLNLSEDQVWEALETLREKKLVERDPPPPGSRAEKFKERTEFALDWAKRQRAIMAELLLRGPQTVGELRTRASRMTAFPDLDAVQETLAALSEGETPFVQPMPREPGKSAIRWTHLLYPEKEQPKPATAEEVAAMETPVAAAIGADVNLREELESLKQEVAELRRRVEDLEGRG